MVSVLKMRQKNDDVRRMKVGKRLFDIKQDDDNLIDAEADSIHQEIQWEKKLDAFIAERNPENVWEARIENHTWKKETGTSNKFTVKTARELLEQLLQREYSGVDGFSVFEFKKNGLALNNNIEKDEWYYVLPACRGGFHRDWEHDGVCAQDLPKD